MDATHLVQMPSMVIPNVSVEELLKMYAKKEAFKAKERERLREYYLKRRLEKAGVETLEEYLQIKNPRGRKMKNLNK